MLDLFLSRRDRQRRTAAQWLVRLQNDPDDATRAAFEAWLHEKPEHAIAFESVRESYGSAGMLAASPVAYGAPERASEQTPTPAPRRWSPSMLAATALAAVLIIAVVVTVLGNSPQAIAVQQRLDITTSMADVRTVTLADGTVLTADAMTTVQVVLGPETREIKLRRGRLRVQVAADSRPFLVEAGGGRLYAPAGTIEIAVAHDGTRVQLLPGAASVAFARDGGDQQPLALAPGQVMLIPANGGGVSETPSTPNDLQWPTGRLEFDSAPLSAVVDEANRYSILPIRVEGADVAALRVTGVFRAGDPGGLARSLAAAFGLALEQKPDELVLRRTPSARAVR